MHVITTTSTETETESTTTTTTTTTKTIINLPPLDINSPCIHFTTFNISKLYFCDDCHQIRCPNCVQEEIVCYYCPNCLFEVPTASVKSERNRYVVWSIIINNTADEVGFFICRQVSVCYLFLYTHYYLFN